MKARSIIVGCILILVLVQNIEQTLPAPASSVKGNTEVEALVMQIDPLMQQKRYSEADVTGDIKARDVAY